VSHNLNTLIKKFTIWTIAIMMANLVVGIFSMNVELPMPTEERIWPFMMVNALAIFVSVGIIWFSRFRKW
jgi:Mg2+ and Co2+ transporter CorA